MKENEAKEGGGAHQNKRQPRIIFFPFSQLKRDRQSAAARAMATFSHPAHLSKAGLVVGVQPDAEARAAALAGDWLTCGRFAVAQRAMPL